MLTSPTARQLREQATERARNARRQVIFVAPLIAAVLYAYAHRVQLFGVDEPIRILAAFVLAALGWWVARDVGRMIGPTMFRRVDVSTAGTVGFLIRLTLLGLTLLIALRIAGLEARSLAVGGAFTAVILGLAAQSTLGNVLSGLMLISARPFSVGERVRLQAGGLAGQIEGTATGFGLLYVTFARGEDTILVPNSVVLAAAIVPLREPASVNLRARLRPGFKPSELQQLLEDAVTTPTRNRPHIALEEVDDEEVIMRITATPESDADGPKLADEVLAALEQVTAHEHRTF
ncbi:MAG: small conductance mechanosensitive channel [Thermoleophilaceae bacterium]|nr:small conductance mechanosensitive channel [Thermoleophilaceae bacterium]